MRSLFLKVFLWFWLAMALVVIVFVVLVASTQESAGNNDNNAGPDRRPESRRGRDTSGDALMVYLQSAAYIAEQDGQSALSGYFNRLENTGRIRTFLFDPSGAEVLRRPQPTAAKSPAVDQELQKLPSPELKQLVKRAGQSEKLELTSSGPLLLAAQRVRVPQQGYTPGRRYIIAGAMRGRPPRGDSPRGGESPRGGRSRDDSSRRNRNSGDRMYRLWLWWLLADPGTQALRLLAVLGTTGFVCYGLVRHLTAPILQLRTATQQLAAGDLSTRVTATLGNRRDELGVLGHDFDLMAERLESLMNAQNRLIANISHELRSPLARLSIALGLVRDTAGPEAAEDLDRIELETERLNTMIGQLLTLSRLESGEQVANKTPVDVARLIQEIAADADFEARSRDCSVRVLASEECVIAGTESLLRSAIENAVRNAVRYTAAGTTVEISLTREPKAQDGREYCVIRVRDQGPGVPEESLEHLFRPFYRVADARDRQSGGTGLGLAITERAVGFHGGTATAANAPGGGLLVEIRLPLARARDVVGASHTVMPR